MGWGLGKNAFVKLQLNKPNYEALIDRHGQYVRWRIAKPCSCVTDNNRIEINCPFCGGSGETYAYQKDYANSFRTSVQDGIAALSDDYAKGTVLSVWDYKGKQYRFTQHCDMVLIDNPPGNGQIVEIKVNVPLTETTDTPLTRVADNIYRADALATPKSSIEGLDHNSPLDIAAIGGITDSTGAALTAIGYRQNLVYVESAEDALQATGVTYILPAKFAILSQNLSKEDFNIVQPIKGGAMCTFPYYLNVSTQDVITVLSGAMTMKHVLKHSEYDTLPQYFVESITSCESTGEKYAYGTDFILAGTNVIQWIAPPPIGTALSFVFNYFPTYKVLQEIPMLRTSENQRLPRKCAIELMAFMENRNLEQQ
jgi:hypothetical protein